MGRKAILEIRQLLGDDLENGKRMREEFLHIYWEIGDERETAYAYSTVGKTVKQEIASITSNISSYMSILFSP